MAIQNKNLFPTYQPIKLFSVINIVQTSILK